MDIRNDLNSVGDSDIDRETLEQLDRLIFEKIGQRLSTIQRTVFRGMYYGKTYEEIAQETRYTAKYIKEVGYKLLKLISQIMEEDIRKANLKASLERRTISNVSNFGRDYIQGDYIQCIQVLNLNLFDTDAKPGNVPQSEAQPVKSTPPINDHPNSPDSTPKTYIKVEVDSVVQKLHQQGMRADLIAEVLNLAIETINQILNES